MPEVRQAEAMIAKDRSLNRVGGGPPASVEESGTPRSAGRRGTGRLADRRRFDRSTPFFAPRILDVDRLSASSELRECLPEQTWRANFLRPRNVPRVEPSRRSIPDLLEPGQGRGFDYLRYPDVNHISP